MRRDTNKSILLCFHETSSESGPQFSQGKADRAEAGSTGMEGARGVLGGLRQPGLPEPSESSAGGGVQESAGPRPSCAGEQVPALPPPAEPSQGSLQPSAPHRPLTSRPSLSLSGPFTRLVFLPPPPH